LRKSLSEDDGAAVSVSWEKVFSFWQILGVAMSVDPSDSSQPNEGDIGGVSGKIEEVRIDIPVIRSHDMSPGVGLAVALLVGPVYTVLRPAGA